MSISDVDAGRYSGRIQGVVASLVTPFDGDGRFVPADFSAQVQRISAAGISSFCVAGGTGEYQSLSPTEYGEMVFLTRDSHAEATIVAGAFELTPQETIERLHLAKEFGADAGMVIAPPFVNLDESQLLNHLEALFIDTPLPLILFETATRTRSALTTQSIVNLSKAHESFVGVKDSYGDLSRLTTLVRETRDGFALLQGRDDLLFSSLCLGVHGSLNSFGALAPRTCNQMVNQIRAGMLDEARLLHHKITDWSKLIYRWTSPVGIKAVMQLLGLSSAHTRAPLSALTKEDMDSLHQVAQAIEESERELESVTIAHTGSAS